MVATKPVDFRKGHDRLAALVKNELHKDPFAGTVFVFRSRKADRLKLSATLTRLVNGHKQSRIDELMPWKYPERTHG
ncbi:IS66 family insertion sequence element accessory protein TnpB [Rhizobium sp. WYCCWR10014]|uniref:IS66 family insertion sequence element accessory protein TnpB n=1 Tax=Rhizobium sp. WYCCWR10014 TaxID=1825933 RepID=UPI0012E8A62C|nr:IS66 family insertion sequence element accessory protein TnpB [Rhizobium sp. WYCCWR10014]